MTTTRTSRRTRTTPSVARSRSQPQWFRCSGRRWKVRCATVRDASASLTGFHERRPGCTPRPSFTVHQSTKRHLPTNQRRIRYTYGPSSYRSYPHHNFLPSYYLALPECFSSTDFYGFKAICTIVWLTRMMSTGPPRRTRPRPGRDPEPAEQRPEATRPIRQRRQG